VTAAKKGGDLLLKLDPKSENMRRSRGIAKPRAGTTVGLWELPGRWYVWSAGPEVSSWWLRPTDEHAEALVEKLTRNPARGAPVVLSVAQRCIAVKASAIR
jgi:hypothetical protein